jgi:hypothetical protein
VEEGDTGTSNPTTDLNSPALDFTSDDMDISPESLFSEYTDFQYYEQAYLPPELLDSQLSNSIR